jgi:hypothetical protein
VNSLPETNQQQQPRWSSASSIGLSESQPADTPLGISREISLIRAEVQKGIALLYDSECKLADKEASYEKTLQLAFINAQGTVADRTAVSRLQAAEARLEADLAKAEWNRVRTKLKALETAQMGLQTQARLLEAELKTLGR